MDGTEDSKMDNENGGTEGVKSFGGTRRDEDRRTEEAGLGSEQVSQVVYIHPVGVYSHSLFLFFVFLFFGGGREAVMTVSAPDPVNTDSVSRASVFKQTHASCYQHARL